MSDRAHVAAWKSAVSETTGRATFTYSEAQAAKDKGLLPTRYVIIRVEHRVGPLPRACGVTPSRGWRLLLEIVGTETEVLYARERLDGLRDRSLSAIGASRLRFETDNWNDDDHLVSLWSYATNLTTT